MEGLFPGVADIEEHGVYDERLKYHEEVASGSIGDSIPNFVHNWLWIRLKYRSLDEVKIPSD